MKQDYSELIRAIKGGDKKPLKEIYIKYRISFTEWAMAKYACTEDEASEVYQDVILTFYENIVEGKIHELRSHIRTYLFGIGRLMILQRFREKKRNISMDQEEIEIVPSLKESIQSFQLELSDRQKSIKQAIHSLGETCREILILYYYNRFTMESIMHKLKYKSTDVVKSQKARCIKTLRERVVQQFDRDTI